MKKHMYLFGLTLAVIAVLSMTACAQQDQGDRGGATDGQQEPSPVPEGALRSLKTEANPTYDGAGDEPAWENATEQTISVSGGANKSATDVSVKSVYTADTVSFLLTWKDETQSYLRGPWEKQADGSWKQLSDPKDEGGDNNLWYEDKMSMIWPIDNSIPDFDTQGCQTTCHAGENSDLKPYGNKYTDSPDQTADIWHWKSVRNVKQVDDQYLDSTKLDPNDLEETKDAGRHSDPDDGGGYKDNISEDEKTPAFMLPAGGKKDGSPGFITDEEKVPFKDTGFSAGDRIPSIVVAPRTGDRGDITAGWQWADGQWTLEFGRKLETGTKNDVQFGNLEDTYYFGLAIFDNAQVRHATQDGATPFVFDAGTE